MATEKSGAEIDAILADHEARISALEGDTEPEPEPGPEPAQMRYGLDMRDYQLYIGSDPKEPGEAVLGPSHMGRTFADPGVSANIIAKGDAASIQDAWQAKPYAVNKRRQFFSMKPDRGKVTSGDVQTHKALAAVARSMTDEDMFTLYHEPENDMTADQWWAMFSPAYETMKNARPGLTIVYCAMTYQHGPGGQALGKSESWCRDSPCDAFGADDYGTHPYPTGANPPPFDQSFDEKPEWMNWYTAAAKQAGPGKGRSLQVHELGRSGKNPDAIAVRPQVLRDANAWLIAHGFDLLLYWNSSTGQADTWWPLDDQGSIQAWREISGA